MFLIKTIYTAALLAVWPATPKAQILYSASSSPFLESLAAGPGHTDAQACAANPAALPMLTGFGAELYFENKYLVPGLDLASAALAYGSKTSGVLLSLRYFGASAYHEFHAAVAYAKTLGGIRAAVSLRYHHYAIPGFIQVPVFSAGLHMLWTLSDHVFMTVQLVDPPFLRVKSGLVAEAAIYHAGWTYELSEDVCLNMDLAKTEQRPLQVNGACRYRFSQTVYGRAGVFSGGPQPFISLGWEAKNFHAEVSITYHPALGCTPGILAGYNRTGGAALE